MDMKLNILSKLNLLSIILANPIDLKIKLSIDFNRN